jgi:hypothetical protein
MKRIKIFILSVVVFLSSSCTLDLLEDPNNVKFDDIQATLVLSNMQSQLAGLFQGTSTFGMQLTRMQNSGGVQYQNVFGPPTFDGTWQTAYAGILQDADNVIKFSDANGWSRHAGIARIISGYTLLQLVDMFGDVPFSEAFQGLTNLNPKLDDDAALYDLVLTMLDQAELDLKTPATTAAPAGNLNPLAQTPVDLYYGNSYTSWLRLINALKIKIFLNLRLVDPARATAGINAAITDTDGLITAPEHNFVFRYGTNLSDPDARHPRFIANYPGGGGNYMSNYLMWQMFHGYDAFQAGSSGTPRAPGDPRIRYYFYRQTGVNNTDPNNIRCVTATSIPDHYPTRVGASIVYGLAGVPPAISTDANNAAWSSTTGTLSRTFCFPSDRGYWGRDHVDNQGIPPDGFLRSAWGVYPSGGRFDADVFQGVTAARGMQGAGFQPLLMRSFVQFMLAEAALYLGTTGTAATYYQTGIQNSMADVRAFSVNGTFGVGAAATTESIVSTFYPTNYAGVFTTNVRVATAPSQSATPTQSASGNLVSLSGNFTVDGVALVDGDRILVKNQTTASQNGIYVVSSGDWTRATDSDAGAELVNQSTLVTEGVRNFGTNWNQTTASPITLGTTSIAWNRTNSWTVDVSNYVNAAVAAYGAQTNNDDRMNYIAREYWIALFGNGVEAYNLYRRTGRPTGMQPTLQPGPGEFPQSFWYPNSAATLNNQIDQKSSFTKVFWIPENVDYNLDF